MLVHQPLILLVHILLMLQPLVSMLTTICQIMALAIVLSDVIECLRDIGIEEECLSSSCGGDMKSHTRFCYSFAGREYARLYSWGSGPKRQVTIHISQVDS